MFQHVSPAPWVCTQLERRVTIRMFFRRTWFHVQTWQALSFLLSPSFYHQAQNSLPVAERVNRKSRNFWVSEATGKEIDKVYPFTSYSRHWTAPWCLWQFLRQILRTSAAKIINANARSENWTFAQTLFLSQICLNRSRWWIQNLLFSFLFLTQKPKKFLLELSLLRRLCVLLPLNSLCLAENSKSAMSPRHGDSVKRPQSSGNLQWSSQWVTRPHLTLQLGSMHKRLK